MCFRSTDGTKDEECQPIDFTESHIGASNIALSSKKKAIET